MSEGVTPAVHPEATPEPSEVRWRYTDVVRPPMVGRVDPVPSALEAAGVEEAVSEPGALVLRLRDGLTWQEAASSVRSALVAALADGDWSVEPNAEPHAGERSPAEDAELRSVVESVLNGPAGGGGVAALAAGHGGGITLVDVAEGVVSVELHGACDGCPAAAMTLRVRMEESIRQRTDTLVEVREVGESAPRAADGCHSDQVTKRRKGLGKIFLNWPHDRDRSGNH